MPAQNHCTYKKDPAPPKSTLPRLLVLFGALLVAFVIFSDTAPADQAAAARDLFWELLWAIAGVLA